MLLCCIFVVLTQAYYNTQCQIIYLKFQEFFVKPLVLVMLWYCSFMINNCLEVVPSVKRVGLFYLSIFIEINYTRVSASGMPAVFKTASSCVQSNLVGSNPTTRANIRFKVTNMSKAKSYLLNSTYI